MECPLSFKLVENEEQTTWCQTINFTPKFQVLLKLELKPTTSQIHIQKSPCIIFGGQREDQTTFFHDIPDISAGKTDTDTGKNSRSLSVILVLKPVQKSPICKVILFCGRQLY